MTEGKAVHIKNFPPELWKAVGILALERGVTMRRIVIDALTLYMNQERHDTPPRTLGATSIAREGQMIRSQLSIAEKRLRNLCLSAVCDTPICARCSECPNRCGFADYEVSPHDKCRDV